MPECKIVPTTMQKNGRISLNIAEFPVGILGVGWSWDRNSACLPTAVFSKILSNSPQICFFLANILLLPCLFLQFFLFETRSSSVICKKVRKSLLPKKRKFRRKLESAEPMLDLDYIKVPDIRDIFCVLFQFQETFIQI